MHENCPQHDTFKTELIEQKARVNSLENRVSNLETGITRTDTKLEFISATLTELKNKIEKLGDIPSKRWETFLSICATGIITLIITLIVNTYMK